MAEYILSILRTQLMVVFSWGFNRPTALPNNEGLAFRVNGFKHRGWVVVRYNEGTDLFNVDLCDNSLNVIKSIENVYLDQLVNMIDLAIERTSDYEKQVKEFYNIQ